MVYETLTDGRDASSLQPFLMRTAVNSAAIVTVKNNGTGTAQNSSSMQLYLLRNRLSASSQVR
jgi:hypothetical protein